MNLNERTKNIASFLLRFSVSIVLLVLVFKLNKIDLNQIWSTLKGARMDYLGLAVIFFLFINLILLFRWYIFMKALNLHVPLFSVMRWFFIGLFCNLFLPTAIGGDIVKTIGLSRETPHKPKVFASALLDRLSGFAGIVIVAVLAFVFGSSLIKDYSVIISILIMAILSLAITAILFNHFLFSWVCQAFRAWPKFIESLMKMHYDIVLLKDRKKDGFSAIALSSLAQVTLAVVMYLVAKALNSDIPLVYFLVFSPMVCVTSTIPSIGGLGVREVGWVYLLSTVGVKENIAVSLSLISFMFMVMVGLIGGIIYVATLSSRRIQHNQTDPGARPKEA